MWKSDQCLRTGCYKILLQLIDITDNAKIEQECGTWERDSRVRKSGMYYVLKKNEMDTPKN